VPPARVRLTAAESSLRRHRKLRLARPQGSASTPTSEDGLRLARPQGSASTSTSEDGLRLARPRARPQPRPRKTVSASPDPKARPQPRPRKTVSASPDPRARPQPRPRRSLRLARPWARTDHATGGYIITLPLASSGYGCWGLVLKCYELRTRQHEMLNVNALHPLKHYSLKDLMNFGRRLRTIQLRRLNLRN
jgi:hypothetical protein